MHRSFYWRGCSSRALPVQIPMTHGARIPRSHHIEPWKVFSRTGGDHIPVTTRPCSLPINAVIGSCHEGTVSPVVSQWEGSRATRRS